MATNIHRLTPLWLRLLLWFWDVDDNTLLNSRWFSYTTRSTINPWVSRIFVFVAALATAIIGGVAFFYLVPHLGIAAIVLAVLVGVGGFSIDSIVYWGDVPKAMRAIFVEGIFNYLENKIILRELYTQYQAESNKFSESLEKKKREFAAALGIDVSKLSDQQQKRIRRELRKDIKGELRGEYEQWCRSTSPDPNYGAKIQNILSERRHEIRLKKALYLGAFVIAVANGAGFAAITYTHASFALAMIFGPHIVVALVIPLLVFAGFAYAMLMFTMMERTIRKNLFKKVGKMLWRVIAPVNDDGQYVWSTYTPWQKVGHVAKCMIIFGGFFAFIALTVLVAIATAGVWCDSSVIAFKALFHIFAHLTVGLNWTASGISYVVVGAFLFTAGLFDFVNGMQALRSLGRHLKTAWRHLTIANMQQGWRGIQQQWREHPWLLLLKLIVFPIAVVILLVLFVLNAVCGGALAGEGTGKGMNKKIFHLTRKTGSAFAWIMTAFLSASDGLTEGKYVQERLEKAVEALGDYEMQVFRKAQAVSTELLAKKPADEMVSVVGGNDDDESGDDDSSEKTDTFSASTTIQAA